MVAAGYLPETSFAEEELSTADRLVLVGALREALAKSERHGYLEMLKAKLEAATVAAS
jgi:hypothetical protein